MSHVITIKVRHLFDPSPLRAEIARRGLKQRELAEKLGCHQVTLSKVLRGIPESKRLILALCAELAVNRDDVLRPAEDAGQEMAA